MVKNDIFIRSNVLVVKHVMHERPLSLIYNKSINEDLISLLSADLID